MDPLQSDALAGFWDDTRHVSPERVQP
jgi:hypothetical protein